MDIYTAVHRACERRLAVAQEVLAAEEEGRDDPHPDVMLAGPFCGCDTCVIREVLDAARPYFAALARAEAAALS